MREKGSGESGGSSKWQPARRRENCEVVKAWVVRGMQDWIRWTRKAFGKWGKSNELGQPAFAGQPAAQCAVGLADLLSAPLAKSPDEIAG